MLLEHEVKPHCFPLTCAAYRLLRRAVIHSGGRRESSSESLPDNHCRQVRVVGTLEHV